MNTKEDFKKEYSQLFKDWTEEKLEEYSTWMANKYSTIKKGDDVIHLEYYHGLIDDDAIKALQKHNWTGNIRELRNVVERLIILSGKNITIADVESFV